MKRLLVALVVVGALLSSALLVTEVSAQFSGLTPDITADITLSPRFPEPGQAVSASLNDYSFNTNGATIMWFINGEALPGASNSRNITITAGELGSNTSVGAAITLPSGATISADTTITPVRTDMLVEADTLTPYFYAGRALPTSGSLVRVTAIPFTGVSQDPSQYSYTWTVGNEVIGGGSQFGKNSVTFRSEFETSMRVQVDVYTRDGQLVTSKAIIVPIYDPELHFYEVNPLRGLLETALLPETFFIGEEMRVRAVPYFFDNNVPFNNLLVRWRLDNQLIQNPSTDPLEITLRRQGQTGSFSLGFEARNLGQLLQGVKDAITINF